MTEPRNRYAGPCTHCGQWVAEGEGTVASVQDASSPTGYRRVPAHIGECPAPSERPTRHEMPLWAVPRKNVLTPAGNLAPRAVALVEAEHAPTADATPVNEAARQREMADYGNGGGVEAMAARTARGRQWLAFWWLEGIRPRPPGLSMDELDAMLGDADVAAMRAEVGRASE